MSVELAHTRVDTSLGTRPLPQSPRDEAARMTIAGCLDTRSQ